MLFNTGWFPRNLPHSKPHRLSPLKSQPNYFIEMYPGKASKIYSGTEDEIMTTNTECVV